MIKPTVGRIVWYIGPPNSHSDQVAAAIITYVWSDDLVNLAIFNKDGNLYARTSVSLIQDDGAKEGEYCAWMPYQKGQAAKTEELEKKANV